MAKKIGKVKFPQTIYVAYGTGCDDEQFLLAAESATDHLSTDGEKVIATYELVETKVGKLIPDFS